MVARTPYFELHIRPMFRVLDHEHMIAAASLDLWDYNQVKSSIDAILARLAADPADPASPPPMPPAAFGGPWPQEWIAVLQRWKDAGFPRLLLGKVAAPGYTAKHAGSQVILKGSGTLPDIRYQAWLEPVIEEGEVRSYIHYWQPPSGAPASTAGPFKVAESFVPLSPIVSIIIRDADGDHTVQIS